MRPAMSLNTLTALGIMGFVSAVAGALLLVSWLQHRNTPALMPWGLAFILAAIGTTLIAQRGQIPDFWSIAVANAIIAIAYGCMWSGARMFEGRRPQPAAAAAGAVIWLVACTIEAFYASLVARVALMTVIGIAYTLLTIVEFWRSRDEDLALRWVIIGLLLVHAASLPVRIPFAPSLFDPAPNQVHFLTFITFESVLLSMCGAYLFGSLVKDRIARRYKHASLVDSLTGAANRRAFLKQGPRILRRSRSVGRTFAVLLFDLDHFKKINDTFGHSTGDDVLTAFCRVAQDNLRVTDFFARLGGEEFACILPDTSLDEALAVGERVRTAFGAARHRAGHEPLTATVSVGVAVSTEGNLASLLAYADRALYRAKQNGRNRVELAVVAVAEPALP
jgi:diguanylate cyclase (GGDEF)-like protein